MEASNSAEEEKPSENLNLSIVAITMTIAALAAAMFFGANVFFVAFVLILIALVLGIIGRRKAGPSWLSFLGILVPVVGLAFWLGFIALAMMALSMFM
jgi:predicted RND superfamily exporter protein